MAASTELSPKDVVNALRTLTDEQTKELFFQLDVPLHVLSSIETRHDGNMRKIYTVQAWFDNDLKPRWEKIVAGLKLIGKKTLAQTVVSQHIIGAPTSVTDNPTADPTNPPALAQASGVTQPPVPTESAPVQALSLVPSTTHSSTSHADKVQQVQLVNEQLRDSFADVICDIQAALCDKEIQDRAFFGKFRSYLLFLPLSKKATHAKFFRESENDIVKAENILRLFAILSRYCDYINYEVILHLVKRFCEEALKKRMLDYCKSLELFEMTTTVDVYCRAISAGKKLSLEFQEMALKIEKPSSECTLHEIRKLKEKIAEESALPSYSVYIGGVAESSVLVVLQFPRLTGCVDRMLAAMTPAFLHAYHLTEVVVDGKQLTLQHLLNHHLYYASWKGDVVRVALLLNSGADVEPVHENFSQTPLCLASQEGHLQTVQLLLQRGARVDSRNANGSFALMIAAINGWTKVVVELAKARANVNLQKRDGNSALIEAARSGETEVLVELVKAGANLNLQNRYGDSALIRAAKWGRTEVVRELVKAGANLNLQNDKGDSAVISATVQHRSGALRELVRAGADLNLQNEEGLTALMISARSGRTELTDILLTGENVDTDIQEHSTGWSALFFSAEAGDVATTALLLRVGANALIKDKNGLIALEVATASASSDHQRRQDYDQVCEVLSTYIGESTASHSHHIEAVHTSGTDQDSSTTDQDGATTTPAIPITGRTRFSQALLNLVNKPNQMLTRLFNQLDRRLKSADGKEVRGKGKDSGQRKKKDQNRPPY